MHSNFQNKNLLIITSAYPDKEGTLIRSKFVKNQVDVLKNYFKTVYVISPLSLHFKFSNVGKLSKDYSYDNVHVYFPTSVFVPLKYLQKPAIDSRLSAVKYIIKKYNLKFDLIHAHMSEPSGYIAMMLKKKYEIPYVLTIHENGIWFEKEIDMNHHKITDAWRFADALIRVNPFDIPILKDYNNNSVYITNGYSPAFQPLDVQSCRKQLSISQDKLVLFGLGILTERKGFQYLIEAMHQISKTNPNVLCYIGGDGPYREVLVKMIQEFNLEENVFLLGRLNDEELPIWMNACDLFVLPSLGEGNPTVMFEAIGCGKPFIGTRVGGIPSIINKDEYGLLCDAGDVTDFISKLEMAITNIKNDYWNKELIVEHSKKFTWENICSEIVSIYEKIS